VARELVNLTPPGVCVRVCVCVVTARECVVCVCGPCQGVCVCVCLCVRVRRMERGGGEGGVRALVMPHNKVCLLSLPRIHTDVELNACVSRRLRVCLHVSTVTALSSFVCSQGIVSVYHFGALPV
jgi:hypothetical protein